MYMYIFTYIYTQLLDRFQGCQNSPMCMPKEPNMYAKRALYVCQQSPTEIQHSPTHVTKESYLRDKRALRE